MARRAQERIISLHYEETRMSVGSAAMEGSPGWRSGDRSPAPECVPKEAGHCLLASSALLVLRPKRQSRAHGLQAAGPACEIAACCRLAALEV